MFEKLIGEDDGSKPQVRLSVDLPGFGLAAGDTLIFDDEWPEHRDLILYSVEANPKCFRVARFLNCFGETIRAEDSSGKTGTDRYRTMVTVRDVVIELRTSKRSKKREDVWVTVSRGKKASRP